RAVAAVGVWSEAREWSLLAALVWIPVFALLAAAVIHGSSTPPLHPGDPLPPPAPAPRPARA
ncbi:MAG TPA: hypothetical protein VNP72_07420, partial [Longimicrobium sp.]|nr:hypothetical protein [Longimicrobium sp.]